MRKRQVWDEMLLITMAMLLLLSVVMFFTIKKERLSYDENRVFAEFPSGKGLLSGEFLTELGEYCSDHFPMRKWMLEAHAISQLMMGRKENNGVLLWKNKWLIKRAEYSYYNRIDERINSMSNFIDYCQTFGVQADAIIVPQIVDIQGDNLGFLFDDVENKRVMKIINNNFFITDEITKLLREKIQYNQSVWFRTDHHWTMEGAYAAYYHYANQIGISPISVDKLERQTVSTSFCGTLYSHSCFFFIEPDELALLRYDGDDNFVLKNSEWEYDRQGFYDFDALQKKDQYAVFLGGNYGHLSVQERGREDKPTLLLIKDSFANAIIPFLAIHFDLEIYDPRYCNDSLADIVATTNPDRVLILCGIDTIAS